ncbi:MAG: hypothetical protein OXC96_03735 [Cyanobacteria bacterium MAG CAR1_bin_15]|nr:hypothetical protein [Cyanobacteria bacterium MAG CAR1_bin_15]
MDSFMDYLVVKFGRWLARDFEKEVTALLKGVFGPLRRTSTQNARGFALGIHTIDAEHDDSPTTLTLETIRKAREKFGSRSNRLSTIVIHSAVYRRLPDKVLYGLKVVVSDAVETLVDGNTTYYATYISAPGVIITAEPRLVSEEWMPDSILEQSQATFSWSDIVHVDGVTWKGDDRVIDGLPRCQLATAANWGLIDKPRNVPIVRITTTAPAVST